MGNGEDFIPHNGRWNFNNKKLVEPTTIKDWAVVNFSARCKINPLINDLIRCGKLKGIEIVHPTDVFEESPQHRSLPPLDRVEKMLESLFLKIRKASFFSVYFRRGKIPFFLVPGKGRFWLGVELLHNALLQ